MKKIYAIAAALLLMAPATLRAQESTVAMPFMAVNLDAASAAMGSMSIYNNAASSVWNKDMAHIEAGYGMWTPKASYPGNDIFLRGHWQVKDFVALRLEFADRLETPYELIDDFGETVGSYKPGSLRGYLGASFKFAEHYSIGVDAVYARRNLYEDAIYNTVAANAAFMMRFKVFNAALGVKNVGMPVKNTAHTGSYMIPSSAFADLAFDIEKGKHDILFGGEFEYMFNNMIAYGAGASYTYGDMVAVRLGYHGGGLFPNHFSAGLGLKFKGITLNATALFGKENMNGTFLAALGYSF